MQLNIKRIQGEGVSSTLEGYVTAAVAPKWAALPPCCALAWPGPKGPTKGLPSKTVHLENQNTSLAEGASHM